MTLGDSVVLGVVSIASVVDLHSRRIPNTLTFGAATGALVVSAAAGGFPGLSFSFAGWAIGLALWLPIYALGGMGAGDIKLMAAVGAWLGPADAVRAALFAAIAGALMALAIATSRGLLRQTVANVRFLLAHWAVAGFAPHARLTLAYPDSPRLAYAVPIFAGTAVAIWLR
jgi:prepilin peptidase CpaA